ncbi:hypothetical protein I79_022376 [Cricetulus griseus]|uniref:Uncharacterized protein n=1 Tax=Cricetulus griseus TaxID=10029 RepID=G3IF60_CRIGR|nr:hypothetical protein I79_022376 [Cricetulus griseus]
MSLRLQFLSLLRNYAYVFTGDFQSFCCDVQYNPSNSAWAVVCIGSAFVLCSVCFSLCVPTGDGVCSTVGVTVTTHMLKPENYCTVHPANSSQSESCTAY